MGLLSSLALPREAARAGSEAATEAISVAADVVAYAVRVAVKAELVLDELLALLQETRPLVPQLVSSLDTLSRAAGNIDAVVPVITALPDTQRDVRVAVETLQTLVGLANLGIGQLEAIPGARLVRRRISRALSEQTGQPTTA